MHRIFFFFDSFLPVWLLWRIGEVCGVGHSVTFWELAWVTIICPPEPPPSVRGDLWNAMVGGGAVLVGLFIGVVVYLVRIQQRSPIEPC